jgi:hypothetical protein
MYADGQTNTNDRNTANDFNNPTLTTSPWTGINFAPGHYMAATAQNLADILQATYEANSLSENQYSFFFYSFDHGPTRRTPFPAPRAFRVTIR